MIYPEQKIKNIIKALESDIYDLKIENEQIIKNLHLEISVEDELNVDVLSNAEIEEVLNESAVIIKCLKKYIATKDKSKFRMFLSGMIQDLELVYKSSEKGLNDN